MAHITTPLNSEPSLWTRWGPGGRGLYEGTVLTWSESEAVGVPGTESTIAAPINLGNGVLFTYSYSGGAGAGMYYISKDYGATWVARGPAGTFLRSACVVGNGILVAANSSGIYRGTDFSGTMTKVADVPAAQPAGMEYLGNGVVLLALQSTTNQLMRSTDYGVSWMLHKGNLGSYQSSAIANLGNGIVVVGQTNRYTARSTDYGLSWKPVYMCLSPCGVNTNGMVAMDRGQALIFSAAAAQRIMRTSDYGENWHLETSLTGASVSVWAVYLGGGEVILVTGSYLYRSADFGSTWTSIGTVPSGYSAYGMTSDSEGRIYLGTAKASDSSARVLRCDTFARPPLQAGQKDTSAFTTITADTTIASSDRYAVYLVSNAASRNVKLPSATACAGRRYVVKRMGAGNVMVSRTGTNTIDGVTNTAVTAQYDSMELQSTGSRWLVINEVD